MHPHPFCVQNKPKGNKSDMATTQILEVAFDDPHNRSHAFAPLDGRKLRSAFRRERCGNKDAKTDESLPNVPGQRLRLDLASGEAEIVDDLSYPEHRELRRMIERRCGQEFQYPPESESLGKIDVATWIYCLHLAVEAGYCRVTEGKLPPKPKRADVPGLPVPYVSDTERLADAIEKLLEKLADKL